MEIQRTEVTERGFNREKYQILSSHSSCPLNLLPLVSAVSIFFFFFFSCEMNVQALHSSIHGQFEASSVRPFRLFSFSSPSVGLSRKFSTSAYRRKSSAGRFYGSSLSCGIRFTHDRIRSALTGELNEVEELKQQEVRRAYPFHEIEPKWQRYWEENRTFRTPDEIDTSKPKFYVLDMFPYPRFLFALYWIPCHWLFSFVTLA